MNPKQVRLQAIIILSILAFALVGSALTIWLVLAWGNGAIAMLTPLALGGALALVTYTVVFRRKGGPS